MFDQPVSDLCRSPCRRASRWQSLLNRRCYGTQAVLLTALAGCGTTGHFVEQPRIAVDGGQQDARQAVAQLFGSDRSYTIKLCEADASSKECKQNSEGISATGVGGLLFPLVLHVSGMRVSQEHPSVDGLALNVSLDSKADGLPPLCADAEGTVISRDNTASIRIGNFYCNWMVVGNVLANTELSIDRIDLQNKTFNGYYKLTFHGTGNVSGSGYYKAVITPVST